MESSVHLTDDDRAVVGAVVGADDDGLAGGIGPQGEFHVRVIVVHVHNVALVLLHHRQLDEVAAVPDLHVQRSGGAVHNFCGAHRSRS